MSWQATYAHRHRRVEIERPEPVPVRPAIGTPEWQREFSAAIQAAAASVAATSERMRAAQKTRMERARSCPDHPDIPGMGDEMIRVPAMGCVRCAERSA